MNNKTPSKQHKKLGLMSCIVVVVGGCVGAGIFFKNAQILAFSQHKIILAILCWLIGGLGVLCMGLSLIEVVTGCKKPSNLGMGAWCKVYNNNFVYKMCRNFIAYLYCPIILVALAYYFVQALFSAIGPIANGWAPSWWLGALIALFVLVWFFFSSGLSIKLYNIQNWVIMCVKFFPIIFAMIIGFIIFGVNKELPDGTSFIKDLPANIIPTDTPKEFSTISPLLGIVASIPAIFFTFNGFQYPANLVNDMKKPQYLPMGMIIGIIIVVVISLAISCSLMFGSSTGGFDGIKGWLEEKKVGWLYSVMYILIGLGILGVINGTVTTCVKQTTELLANKEILLSSAINKHIVARAHNNQILGGVIYQFAFTFVLFVICTTIGCVYIPMNQITGVNFGKQILGIFNFVDLVSNWDVLGVYIFIGVGILGALINRKTNKVKVQKKKYFMPCAIVSVALVAISTLYLVVAVFVDLGYAVNWYSSHNEWYYDNSPLFNEYVLPKILSALMLLLFTGVIVIPACVKTKKRVNLSR